MTTIVYTDGACSGNPGPGGWGWVVPDGPFAAGPSPDTTNQRMEIQAAYEATKAIEGPLEIVSDSTYVVKCFNDRWWEGWIRRGWTNSAKKPVANRDLWEPFIELVRARGDVTFRWVKGHAGNEWNDIADRLAVEATTTQQPRSGTETPTSIGEPDQILSPTSPTSPNRAGRSAPTVGLAVGELSYQGGIGGHGLVVLGHRPPALGGYDENPIAADTRRRLSDIIAAKAQMHDDLVVVSGLRLGAEILGAEAALDAGVPFVAVLPYPEADKPWPAPARERFGTLLAAAAGTLTLEKKSPDSKEKAAGSLRRRDAWLARHSTEALLVWDHEDGALAKLHKTLVAQLGDDVWVVPPG